LTGFTVEVGIPLIGTLTGTVGGDRIGVGEMVMELNDEQRTLWADKLMDLANLAIAALVFGSLLSPGGLRWSVVVLGLGIYLILAVFATRLRR